MAGFLSACQTVTFGDDQLTLNEMQATAGAVFAEAAVTANAENSPAAADLPVLIDTPTPIFDANLESSATAQSPDIVLGELQPTATQEMLVEVFPPTATAAAPPFWEVYFTDPRRAGAGDEIIARLISLINGAQRSIHVAAFEFNLDSVAEALISAHARGVEVVWITDNEYGLLADQNPGRGQFARLQTAGITVVPDTRAGLMHNKFWVFDEQTVWTGSMNITVNDTQSNNNNVIILHTVEVANIYEREFQEMLVGQFGPRSPSTVAEQWAIVEGVPIQVFFGPEDNVMSELSRLVDAAQQSIRFMAFSFTYEPLGFIMRSSSELGLDVAGIFEALGSKTSYSEMRPFLCAGVPVVTDGNPRLLHHKVIILDSLIVISGSANFSANAHQSNDENLLIIASPEMAQVFLDEFERRWAEGRTPEFGVDYACD